MKQERPDRDAGLKPGAHTLPWSWLQGGTLMLRASVLALCLVAASCAQKPAAVTPQASAYPVSHTPPPAARATRQDVVTVDRLAQACTADLQPRGTDDALVIGFCRGFVTGVVQLLREQNSLCAGSDRTLDIARRAATRMRGLSEQSGIDPYSPESASAGQATLLAAILLASACPATT